MRRVANLRNLGGWPLDFLVVSWFVHDFLLLVISLCLNFLVNTFFLWLEFSVLVWFLYEILFTYCHLLYNFLMSTHSVVGLVFPFEPFMSTMALLTPP